MTLEQLLNYLDAHLQESVPMLKPIEACCAR